MVCQSCQHVYPIASGIPNMVRCIYISLESGTHHIRHSYLMKMRSNKSPLLLSLVQLVNVRGTSLSRILDVKHSLGTEGACCLLM
jgi:hypothetical protein